MPFRLNEVSQIISIIYTNQINFESLTIDVNELEKENKILINALSSLSQQVPIFNIEVIQKGMNIIKEGKNLYDAVSFFQDAAEEGNLEGMWRYGRCLYCGVGVDLDEFLGKSFLKRSSDYGNPDGMWFYSMTLTDDIKRAVLIQKLASLKHPAGLWQYGMNLYYGHCINKDEKKACESWKLAAETGEQRYLTQYLNYARKCRFGLKNDKKELAKLEKLEKLNKRSDFDFFFFT